MTKLEKKIAEGYRDPKATTDARNASQAYPQIRRLKDTGMYFLRPAKASSSSSAAPIDSTLDDILKLNKAMSKAMLALAEQAATTAKVNTELCGSYLNSI